MEAFEIKKKNLAGSLGAGSGWGVVCRAKWGKVAIFIIFCKAGELRFFNLTNILNGIKYQCRLIYETGMLQK